MLRTVRAVAVLTVLFGIGSAGSGFESRRNARGIDTGVFGNGILALLFLKDPPDGETFPVWVGRACVAGGVAVAIGITVVLDRARRRTAAQVDDAPPPV